MRGLSRTESQLILAVALHDLYENIKDYPIVPFHYKWTGTPFPMSAVAPLIGKQRELNKSHQIMLHNANLASNLRWMYEEGSVPEEEWEQYSSSAGSISISFKVTTAGLGAAIKFSLNNKGVENMPW